MLYTDCMHLIKKDRIFPLFLPSFNTHPTCELSKSAAAIPVASCPRRRQLYDAIITAQDTVKGLAATRQLA
jgi:hypothetical protein